MKKDVLKKLRTLKATDTMMKIAGMDVPRLHHFGYSNRTCDAYKYGIYMRCQILSGILKVAFFLADEMRRGINRPVYELFINKEHRFDHMKKHEILHIGADNEDGPEMLKHNLLGSLPSGYIYGQNTLGIPGSI